MNTKNSSTRILSVNQKLNNENKPLGLIFQSYVKSFGSEAHQLMEYKFDWDVNSTWINCESNTQVKKLLRKSFMYSVREKQT